MKFPHGARGATRDDLAGGVDILPTILDVVDAPTPAAVQGRSLRKADAPAERWLSSQSYRSRGAGFTSIDGGPAEIAMFHGTLKQIIGGSGGVELYDLSPDPHELRNVYGRIAMPSGWEPMVAAAVQQSKIPPPNAVRDPEVLRQLRALGYLR